MPNKSVTCHMTNEKRLIDAYALMEQFDDSFKGFVMKRIIETAPTVDAVSVEDLERILSTTQGLELWDYQKRGIMSAVYRLCGKEKNDE